MPYVGNWDDFVRISEDIYFRNPMKTRSFIKYCHAKGYVVLKITDNKYVSNICYLNFIIF